jgi:hypothetical protein
MATRVGWTAHNLRKGRIRLLEHPDKAPIYVAPHRHTLDDVSAMLERATSRGAGS